jgi:hypothetical protein
MKIAAFLQLRNELENGHLIRCMENCRRWATDIFIYDDASTDGSQEVYKRYTGEDHIIFGKQQEFHREIFHKQDLLTITLKSDPEWIVWIDGDAILSRTLTEHCADILKESSELGFDGLKLHYLNLWRHPAYCRLDNWFNSLWVLGFWRNNGQLKYEPSEGLHHSQAPEGMQNVRTLNLDCRFIHYGFASREWIVKKYLMYKNCGQTGYNLDRLLDEQSSFELFKVDKLLYPVENIPEDYDSAPMPLPESYNEVRFL